MKRTRRIFTLLIASVLLLSSLFACGPTADDPAPADTNDTPDDTATQNDPAKPQEPTDSDPDRLEWEDATDPITLTFFQDFPEPRWKGWGEDDVTKWITEKTGVTIDINFASTDDHQQIMTMIASDTLPDLLFYGTQTPVRSVLWSQGYLYPANKLIDEYAPKLRDILPEEMENFWTEDDGNFYVFPMYFSVPEIEMAIPGNLTHQGGFTLNRDVYAEIGSPAMDTIDDYVNVLRQVKAGYPDMYPLFMGHINHPRDNQRNAVQLINRVYGGNPVMVIQNDKVHLNFRDTQYQQALQFLNMLYREDLVKADNFLNCVTANREAFEQIARDDRIFSYWGQCMTLGSLDLTDDACYWPWPMPKHNGIDPKISSITGTISLTNRGMSITKNSQAPDRAIKFVEFLFTREAQFATYHGIIDKHIEFVEDMPRVVPEYEHYWDDWGERGYELGIMAVAHWLTTLATDGYYYYWLNYDRPFYGAISDTFGQYEHVERMENLIRVESGSDESVIETRINELWANSLPKIILAGSEEESSKEYQAFIDEALRMGLEELEDAYTQSYLEWKSKIN